MGFLTYRQYKILKPTIYFFTFTFIVLCLVSLTYIVSHEIIKTVYSNFTYALFAANVVLGNGLFSLGRSAVFIERNDALNKKLIYYSGLMFLSAGIICFFLSGWVFCVTDSKLDEERAWIEKSTRDKIILYSLSFSILIALSFSIAGLVYFVKWMNRVLKEKGVKLIEDQKKSRF